MVTFNACQAYFKMNIIQKSIVIFNMSVEVTVKVVLILSLYLALKILKTMQ